MRRFIAARVLQAAVVVAIVTTIAFLLIRLAPGEPFAYDEPTITPEVQAHWRAAYGWDRPVLEQYVRYVSQVARGELGYSTLQNRPVSDVLADAAPRTLLLAFVSLTLATILGVAVGAFAASRYRRLPDRIISALSVSIYSIPEFWLALLVQLTLGSLLGWFPIGGYHDPITTDYGTVGMIIGDRLRHLVMPALTLTIALTVILARFQRSALVEVLPSDYLRTARAKGATEGAVLFRHGLRNALTPTITMLGLLTPTVLGGIYFVEWVFNWNGLGWLAVTAVRTPDYDLATANVIVSGVLVAVGSLAADVATAIADPRQRDA